jgi:hypothetical protein
MNIPISSQILKIKFREICLRVRTQLEEVDVPGVKVGGLVNFLHKNDV